ncbi:uncharacterized protein LOC114458522 [Gouania willdenowi]|uniref:uncharacterized protein LOC114458522 n=1 Tax=Gouania willdenowi TaxID=441366 RepID=UPI00105609F1|nr:uncharacterized protein LOC114458522 [Gouania willdenowi]
MMDPGLLLEALSVLSGCNVESTSGPSQLSPQDFINVVALRQFYKQEGLKELDYPSLGTMSLQDQDLYQTPPSLPEVVEEPSLRTTIKINLEDFFHPNFNYDFTNVKDGDKQFLRGNERYVRPCGWNRAAIRVVGHYGEGDGWLGTGTDAWPVSYHGHNMDGSLGIILKHKGNPDERPDFQDAAAACLVADDTQGRGVYSTPDVKTAEKFCKIFSSKVDGKKYKVVLQNRINPKNRIECQRQNVWVVYIPEGRNPAQTRAIVQESLRPYGLLLKAV